MMQNTHKQVTEQKMKFSIKDFFSKCDQVRRELQIWLHLLKKSLVKNFIFCAVIVTAPKTKVNQNKGKIPEAIFELL